MRADAERNRRQLLVAACQTLLELGPDAPLEPIARRAGVGIGTLYRHFPDRSTLLRAVAEDVLARAAAEAGAALAEEPTGFAALRRYMHRALDTGVSVMSRIHVAMEIDAEYEAWAGRCASVVQQIIQRARHEGTLRTDAEMGDIWLALVRFGRPIGGAFAPELERDLAHRHLDIYLGGLRAESATPLSGEAALSLERLRAMERR